MEDVDDVIAGEETLETDEHLLKKQLEELLETAGTKYHPFDLKNDDLVRIKVLFPENAILFQVPKTAGRRSAATKVRNNISGGLDLLVSML